MFLPDGYQRLAAPAIRLSRLCWIGFTTLVVRSYVMFVVAAMLMNRGTGIRE